MIVKIHPRDVVAFPDQYQMTKARCCRYEVIHEIKWVEAKDYFMDSDGVFVPPQEQIATATGFYLIDDKTGEYFREFGEGMTLNREEAHIFTNKDSTLPIFQNVRRIPVHAPDERTILQRIERLEQHIGLLATSTIAGRLDAIDKALGLEPIEPMTARLDRAEAQLALS